MESLGPVKAFDWHHLLIRYGLWQHRTYLILKKGSMAYLGGGGERVVQLTMCKNKNDISLKAREGCKAGIY